MDAKKFGQGAHPSQTRLVSRSQSCWSSLWQCDGLASAAIKLTTLCFHASERQQICLLYGTLKDKIGATYPQADQTKTKATNQTNKHNNNYSNSNKTKTMVSGQVAMATPILKPPLPFTYQTWNSSRYGLIHIKEASKKGLLICKANCGSHSGCRDEASSSSQWIYNLLICRHSNHKKTSSPCMIIMMMILYTAYAMVLTNIVSTIGSNSTTAFGV